MAGCTAYTRQARLVVSAPAPFNIVEAQNKRGCLPLCFPFLRTSTLTFTFHLLITFSSPSSLHTRILRRTLTLGINRRTRYVDSMDPDFNSSDVEFEPEDDSLSRLGARSIASIIDSAFADRVESKKKSKQLQFTKGAPGTVHLNATWMNRFVSFQIHTLSVE